MRYLMGALVAIFLILVLIFAIQNMESVDILFITWTMTLPKSLVIIMSYILGTISGYGLFQVLRLAFQKM